MNESMLTKILTMFSSEQQIKIYNLPTSSEPFDDRTLILSDGIGRVNLQELTDCGYEICRFYADANGIAVFEVEESEPIDGELTLNDILCHMYSSERAVVVIRPCKSHPLATIYCGTVFDLRNTLCSGDEIDENVICAVDVRDVIAGDEIDCEHVITIELQDRNEVFADIT